MAIEKSTYVGSYEDFINAVEDEGFNIINVTGDFSLEGDVAIDRSVIITSGSVCTIDADTHSFIIKSGGSVSLNGGLSLTGTSTTVQVSEDGVLSLPVSYSGTISTTGAGGKALYVLDGARAVNIAGGTISAGSSAKSALCLGNTNSVTVSGGTISGSGNAYGIYMENAYGMINININESGPDIDDVYYYWDPSDAPERAGDYPLLTSLPAIISMGIGEVMTLDVGDFTGEEVEFSSYYLGDYPPELNVVSDLRNKTLTLSPEKSGDYNLIIRLGRVKLTLPVRVTSGFAGGDGTSGDPYRIETAEQLNRVRNFLGPAYKDTYFQLTVPIDLSSYTNWVPIGDFGNPFCGHFYGTTYDSETETYIYLTISNLSINRPDASYVGLFGNFAGADIRGVAIRNANVTGSDSGTGALVGQSVSRDSQPTLIEYCSATGTVTAVGGFAVGGLVGIANDTDVRQSYSTASVTGTLSSYAGGLVGYLYRGSIENSYATGPVTSTGTDGYAGGLVGWNTDSEIHYCYAAGKVTGEGETGGLIGLSSTSNIIQSYFNVANAGSSDNGSKGIGVKVINLVYQSNCFEDWDFDIYLSEIWRIDPGASYPYLRLNEQTPHPAPPAVSSARIVGDSGDSRYNAATKTLTMTYGDNEASFSAEDVTPADGLVMWSSNDTAVTDVYVNSDGIAIVGPVDAGTATISLKSANGNTLDSITVIVEPVPLLVNGGFEVDDKEYDGSINADITATSSLSLDTSNCVSGDAANLTANFVATFSDPDAGQDKTVSLSNSYLTGSAAGNYVLNFSTIPEVTGIITPKELTIGGGFTAQSKAYDGTTDAAIASNNLTLIGRVGNDDVTLVPVLAFDTPDIATGKTVSLTAGSSLTGAKAGNYTLSITGAPIYTSGVITDKQATLGGSFTVNNKEYSGDKAATIATNNLTLVGVNSGDDVFIASVTAEFDSAAAGGGKTARITGVTLTGTNAGNYSVSFAGAPTATANITAKPLPITGSFTVEDRQYDGTVNAVIDTSALMLNGIIGSDIVSLNASAAFDDANVGTGKTVTLAGSTLTGADAANYILDFTGAPTTTAEITKVTGLQKPAAPTLQSKTSTSVTLTPNAEQEFSKDNGTTWQTSNVFTGLTPSTEYSFITRTKDDANHEASPASDALTVKTDAPPSPGGPSGGSGSSSSRSTSSTGSLEIPSSFVSDPNSGKTLTLGNDFASVTIPADMLDDIPGIAGKRVEIIIGQGDKSKLPDSAKAAIGDRPLIRLSLTLDGKQTDWSNPAAPVTVSIPYTPTAEELANPESIVVWYIDGSGNVVTIPNGRYDAATGTVSFFTTHFSDYAVTYVHKTFNDLGSAEWARKAIETMAAKGITSGTGDGTTFSPGLNITRADFMVLLIKTLGLTAEFTENFDDVKPGVYYYNAIGIAKKLGIAAGCGNNLFKPTESISRQDMMVLAARALEKYQGLEAAETNAVLERFTDRKEVAGYAALSLATLIEAGITEGSGGRLTPRAYTTWAEVAAFLYKIYNKYPKAPTYTDSEFSRLAGQNRVDTALSVAKAAYPDKITNAVLATADYYPDALAGSVLAYKLDAPILLVGSSEADQQKVLDYLKSSMEPDGTVYILGGTAAVSSGMENMVQSNGFKHITRIAGETRYDTAAKITEQLNAKTRTPVVLVSGENYPDALSSAALRHRTSTPSSWLKKTGLVML